MGSSGKAECLFIATIVLLGSFIGALHVTPTVAAAATITTSATTFYSRATLMVTINDPNKINGVTDNATVTVDYTSGGVSASATIGFQEYFDTGIFKFFVGNTTAINPANPPYANASVTNRLALDVDKDVKFTYFSVAGPISATVSYKPVKGVLSNDRDVIPPAAILQLTIVDQDWNLDPTKVDNGTPATWFNFTINLEIPALGLGRSMNFNFTETEINTAVFTSSIDLGTVLTPNEIASLRDGMLVFLSYVDAEIGDLVTKQLTISVPANNLVVLVYNSTDQPAAYAGIYGYGPTYVWGVTDANGRLELNVPAGEYTVCADSYTYRFFLFKRNIVVNIGTVTTVVFNASEGTVPVTIQAQNLAGAALSDAQVYFALVEPRAWVPLGSTDVGGKMVVRVSPSTYHVLLFSGGDETYFLYKMNIPVSGPLATIYFGPTLLTEAILQVKFHNTTLNQLPYLSVFSQTVGFGFGASFSTVVLTPDTYYVWMSIVSNGTWWCNFESYKITLTAGSTESLEFGGHLWLSLKAGGSYKPGGTVNVSWNLTDSYGHEVRYVEEWPPGTAEQYAQVRKALSTSGRVGSSVESSSREHYPRLEIRDPYGNLLLNQTLRWDEKPYRYLLPSNAAAGTYKVKMIVNTGAYEGVMVAEHRFKVLEPDVTIYTDKPVYRPGDNMNVSIRLSNMGSGRTLRFLWYLYLYNWYPVWSGTFPISTGTDQTFPFQIPIGNLGGTSFYAAWVVALNDPYTNKLVSLDYAFWQYQPTGGSPTTPEQFANQMAEAARNATSQALPKAP